MLRAIIPVCSFNGRFVYRIYISRAINKNCQCIRAECCASPSVQHSITRFQYMLFTVNFSSLSGCFCAEHLSTQQFLWSNYCNKNQLNIPEKRTDTFLIPLYQITIVTCAQISYRMNSFSPNTTSTKFQISRSLSNYSTIFYILYTYLLSFDECRLFIFIV